MNRLRGDAGNAILEFSFLGVLLLVPLVYAILIVLDIQKEVEAGQTLSASMRKYPRGFNNLFVGLVRAGEVGGVLEESLQRLSQFLEKDVELRRKVKSAMTYPVIVMGVAGSGSCVLSAIIATWMPKIRFSHCSTKTRFSKSIGPSPSSPPR